MLVRRSLSCPFQSTPSVGRATRAFSAAFNSFAISIHALRGEGDTDENGIDNATTNISIHALRGEGDMATAEIFSFVNNFNPRPPWGGRPTAAS